MIDYYVVKSKDTGFYFRGKGVNRWGKYFNQASVYRLKANAVDTASWLSMRGEPSEVVKIRITENTTDVPENNVGKWIPVTERLPEPDADVLTFCFGSIDILTYRYNRRGQVCFMFRDDCGYWKETFAKVSHWMPLPEPPKGD